MRSRTRFTDSAPRQGPMGEETWLRRDADHPGGAALLREILIYMYILGLAVCMTIGAYALVVLFQMAGTSFFHAVLSTTAVFGLLFLVVFQSSFCWLRMSKLCPLWLYGESINPAAATIFRFGKSVRTIELRSSLVETRKVFFVYYTIYFRDARGDTLGVLPILSAQERDLVMRHCNQAGCRTVPPYASSEMIRRCRSRQEAPD